MAMKPSHWTSSYNAQYRDQNSRISPNAGEPMHHFPGFYDPSHHQRDGGFYGTRAQLAATARANGPPLREPQPGSNVGFGAAPTQQRTSNITHSFYAPPPEPSTQHYSAMRQTGMHPLQTQRLPADGQEPAAGSSSARGVPTLAPYGGDLWTAPLLKHGEVSAYPGPNRGNVSAPAPFNGQFGNPPAQSKEQFASTSRSGGASGLVDTAFVDASDEWRYDRRGVAQTKGVELHRNTDPRVKYHIPGYAGFVRGKEFQHGDTFGKTTRACLDVPLDYPTDVDL